MSTSEGKPASVSHTRASLMLVLVTVVWGLSFTWTRSWQLAAREGPVGELLSALTLIAVRMPLALGMLALWKPAVVTQPTGREHAGGMVLGTVFFAGFVLQTWGLAWTTPALSAFFTCLCSLWVAPLAFAIYRTRVAPLTATGLFLALAGCAVLVEGWKLGRGEWLTLGASVLFAGQVLVLDRLGKSMEPSHLSASFLAATAILAVGGALAMAWRGPGIGIWLEWVWGMLQNPGVLRGVVCLALFSTVLGFHWMNTYQPRVGPVHAALIYLLEPVFSSIFSIALGYDEITWRIALGGGVILAGNLVVEVARMPTVARLRASQAEEPG